MLVVIILFISIWIFSKLLGTKVGYWYGLIVGALIIMHIICYDGETSNNNDASIQKTKVESGIVLMATDSGFVEK